MANNTLYKYYLYNGIDYMFTKHNLTHFFCSKKILIQKKLIVSAPVFKWSNVYFSIGVVYIFTGVEPTITTFTKKLKSYASFINSNSNYLKHSNLFFFQIIDKFSLCFLSHLDNINYLRRILKSGSTHINIFAKDCFYNPETFNIFGYKLKSVYIYSFWLKIRCPKYLVTADFLRLFQVPFVWKDKNIPKDEVIIEIPKLNLNAF